MSSDEFKTTMRVYETLFAMAVRVDSSKTERKLCSLLSNILINELKGGDGDRVG